MIDPFFDESANELSSIEQSNAPVVAEAYEEAELGFNPYEQAKRQALKQQGSAIEEHNRPGKEAQPSNGFFVSPIADMHTP